MDAGKPSPGSSGKGMYPSLTHPPLAFLPPKQLASSFLRRWEAVALPWIPGSASWYLSAPGTSLCTW